MAMSEDDEIVTIMYEQRQAFADAEALTTDLDLTYHLQMQEAVMASLAMGAASSSSSQAPQNPMAYDGVLLSLAEELLLSDVERLSQERRDRVRRTHDQRMVGDIYVVPDDYWAKHGDLYGKPYGESSSSSRTGPEDALWLFFKGLVSEVRVGDTTVPVAGAGVAICDHWNSLRLRSRKNVKAVYGGQVICKEAAELEALLEGLNKALDAGFVGIFYVIEDQTLYKFVTEQQPPKNSHVAMLLHEIFNLQMKFTFCAPSLVSKVKFDHAFQSAREAIVSQITASAESGKGKSVKETCIICCEDTDVAQMFSVSGCLHRYCFLCMKRHIEAKLQDGMIPKCPHEGCDSEVAISSCPKFLPPNLVEVLSQRIKESKIPVTRRIYCPQPKCSELMSKDEVLTYTKNFFVYADQCSARKCMKCHKFFCMDCKVMWHYNLTCKQYKLQNPNHHGDEQMLESLAKRKLWRQCAKCSHMVELLEGCFHITCRCGHEFCYTCGAEWKNKNSTCKCPIWNERNIVRDIRRRQPQALPQPQPQLQPHQPRLPRQPRPQLQPYPQQPFPLQPFPQPRLQPQPRPQRQPHPQPQRRR